MSDVALEIPRRLNDPPRMFWWEIDISLLFLAAVLAGMIAGFFVTGCVAGVLLAWVYDKAKSGEHLAFALHLLYWRLPAPVSGLKCTPPSQLRETGAPPPTPTQTPTMPAIPWRHWARPREGRLVP